MAYTRKRKAAGQISSNRRKRRSKAAALKRSRRRRGFFNPRKPARKFNRFDKKVLSTMGKVKELKYALPVQSATNPTIYESGGPYSTISSIRNTIEGWLLNGIQQGDSTMAREGDTIYLRWLRVGGYLALGDTYNFVRIMVIRAESSYFTAGIGDYKNITLQSKLVKDRTAGVGAAIKKVYFDKLYKLDSQHPIIRLPKYIRLNDTINYTGPNSTDYCDKLALLVISDSSAAPNPGLLHFPEDSLKLYWQDY